ncbi:MAG: hypothetical protein JWM89_1633, partial [Acidimicrobiales bacterium]|nr:hypothetical protein [Acidimicrobiales bacterium]
GAGPAGSGSSADPSGSGAASDGTAGSTGASELAGGAGRAGAAQSAAGGSGSWRPASPAAYRGRDSGGLPWVLAAVLLGSLLLPSLVVVARRGRAAR